MSTLLVDIGNTRVKWALLQGTRLGAQRAAAHAGWSVKDFAVNLFKGAGDVERVIVASVVSKSLERSLSQASRQRCGAMPEFIKTRRRAAGVTTKYEEPWRLGVDRFVASIGAHLLMPGAAVCVVDIGTAMTFDLVDERGIHRGGAIVPGPDLMVSSLLKDTIGIQRRARGSAAGRTLFARNTRAAIEQGARYAAAAAIDRAVIEARRGLKRPPRLILTGGGAEQVRKLVTTPYRLVPNLVLRGLAAMA
jgi:type III pantothenate kinase